MANMCGASLQCVAIRVTELDFDGTPSPGNGMYVTDNLVKIDFNPEIETGDEVSVKNAAGNLCVAYQTPDVMKRINLSVEICVPDPELEVMFSGGDLFKEGEEVMGFSYPELMVDATPNGVSLEAWTRYIVDGSQPASQPYIWWIFPKAKLRKGNRTIDINAMANVYEGFSLENPEWDTGPNSDWEYDSSRVVAAAFTDTIPTVKCGASVVPGSVGAATGANAGIPGTWTPSGSDAPVDIAALIAGTPNAVVANPATAWTTGQFVQTGTAGAPGQGYWNGTAWVAGTAT